MRPVAFLLFLLCATSLFGYEDPPPTEEQQTAILSNIAHFVEQYLDTIPNLICTKTTEQFKGNKNGEHWKQGDTLTARLTLVQGKETANLVRVNNQAVANVHRTWKRPLETSGEFGVMLSVVLSKSSDAKISWNKWETLNGKHVAVFNYAIDRDHSTLSLALSDIATAVLPYHGSLLADPETGTVWRVTDEVTDIPKELQTLEMQTILDYGEASIGGKTYILPVRATALERSKQDTVRNEIAFADYRKFEAESTIKFDTAPSNAQPEPPAPH